MHGDRDSHRIDFQDEGVSVGPDPKYTYAVTSVPAADFGVRRGANAHERDVPYTLWQVGKFPPGRHLVRNKLTMTDDTFRVQLGDGSFDAYGEEILL